MCSLYLDDNLYMLSICFQRGRTPLIAACEGGHSETALLLIEKGADLSSHVRPHLILQSFAGVCLMYMEYGVTVLFLKP